MGIPAPRFDYDAMATPGGIGQGLAGLGGALANAAARRRQAAVDEQRLAQQQQGMAQQQANSDRGFDEGRRQFDARQINDGKRLGLEGLRVENETRRVGLAGLPNMVDEARIRNLDASTKRMGDPSRATPAKDPRIIPPAVWNQLDQAALEETDAEINRIKLSPEYTKEVADSKGFVFGLGAGPAPRDLNAQREQLLRQNRERRGLSAVQPWQGGSTSTPANASPAAAGTLRKRVAGAYGAQIPPDVLARLAEAEAGDEDAILDVEEALSGGVMVDPEEDPTTLLGQ